MRLTAGLHEDDSGPLTDGPGWLTITHACIVGCAVGRCALSSRRDFLRLVGGSAVAAGAGACGPKRAATVAPASPAAAMGHTGLVRIGSNENGSGPGPAALEAIRGGVAEANRYPFTTIGELVSSIASALKIDSSQLLL